MLCLPPSTRKPIGGAQRGQILIEDSSCVFSLNFRLVRMEVCHKGHYKPGQKSFGWWINGLSGAKWCSPALGSSIKKRTQNGTVPPCNRTMPCFSQPGPLHTALRSQGIAMVFAALPAPGSCKKWSKCTAFTAGRFYPTFELHWRQSTLGI